MKIFNNILIIGSVIALFSCSQLEPLDENLLGEDRLNYDPAFAEGLLLNAYENMSNQFLFNDVVTDDAVNNSNTDFNRMATGEWSAINAYTNRWNHYESVFYVNKFLTVIDNVTWKFDEEQNELFKQRMRGEALAMRALRHFWILQEHAGVGESGELLGIPYFTKFSEYDEDFNVPRLSFQSTVDSINKDFDEALEYLPMDFDGDIAKQPARYKDYNTDSYSYVFGKDNDLRISGRIVKAFKAKLALLAASPAFLNDDNNSYQKVVDILAELINDNGGVDGLDPNGHTDFYRFAIGTRQFPEVLWRSNVSNSYQWLDKEQYPPSLNGEGKVNPTQNLVDAFPMLDGYPFSKSHVDYDASNPYAQRDPRLKAYILYYGNDLDGRGLSDKDAVDVISNKSTRSGYYLKKLLDEKIVFSSDGSQSASEKFNVYLRYTDLYLMFAEAANEIGGPNYAVGDLTPHKIIAAIRKRAGIGLDNGDAYLEGISSKEDMRELIRNERRLELCFEGHRFFDLRRWKMLDLIPDVKGMRYDGANYIEFDLAQREYPDYANYAPIPQSEIVKFDAIEQNKGW